MTNYPNYFVHWKTGHGELRETFRHKTPIYGHEAYTSHIRLASNGTIVLLAGYIWDFGSGPAVDTPDMVYASIVHDALYELMKLDRLPWGMRKAVDNHFHDMLKESGMPWWRRLWVYAAVRWGYPLWSKLFKPKKVPGDV